MSAPPPPPGPPPPPPAQKAVVGQGRANELEDKAAAVRELLDTAQEVIGSLFLANIVRAGDHAFLAEKGIKRVLTVGVMDMEPLPAGVEHKVVPIRDDLDEDLLAVLDDAVSWIAEGVKTSPAVPTLVHCEGGISRSAAVVLGYLIAEERLSFKDAYDRVKALRRYINPNASFVMQLNSYSARLQEANSR